MIDELRRKYPLKDLLVLAKLSKSTFFYILGRINRKDKDAALKEKISQLYATKRKGNEKYGYRRICLELRKTDEFAKINHKKVQRLMKELGLFGYISKNGRRKYSSYRGAVGIIADNVVARHFNADRPNKLWSTDVTEFALCTGDVKVYLSPIKDFCDGSIVSHNCSTTPDMKLDWCSTVNKGGSTSMQPGERNWVPDASHRACHAKATAWTTARWRHFSLL